jgi:hypothetical protein
MSCDWNIFCLDCEETERFNDANHQVDLMRDIIKAAPGIAALAPYWKYLKNHDVELNTHYGHINVEFFAKHATHRLVPRSEYGEIDGTCAKDVRCPCKRNHYCVLPKEHAGDCSWEIPK